MKKSLGFCLLAVMAAAFLARAEGERLQADDTPHDLGGATYVSPRIMGGAGVFTHAALVSPTLCPTRDASQTVTAVPRFGEEIVFSGKVSVFLGAARPAVGTQVVVATYEGAAPDLATWQVAAGSAVTGTFAAADGQVVLTVSARPSVTLKVH